MTVARVSPSMAVGSVRAPPSKSYTHRALVAGHLAHRRYRIENPLDAQDTLATARAVGLLGTPVLRRARSWTLRPAASGAEPRAVSVDCGESGTTLRFVAALAARAPRWVTLRGRGRLPERPMAPLWNALTELGATVEHRRRSSRLPATLHGPMHGGSITLDASESSQFTSALLLVLPTLGEDSRLTLSGEVVSRPYVDATLAVLRYHGVEVKPSGRGFQIPGGQHYRRHRFEVPGDASSAAYLWVAAALTGGCVTVRGVPGTWPQADLAILDLLDQVGAEVRRAPSGATVRGGLLHPFRVDLTDAPDLYPLAGVLATAASGESRLAGAAHVALKESDRRAGTAGLARALGAKVTVRRDGLRVHGRGRPRPIRLLGLRDHRLVMSAAVAALAATGRSTIGDARAVEKSFPEFWSELGRLTRGVDVP